MKLRELYTTFIFEGPADVVKSLRATYSEPNQIDYINKNYEWIRNTFPKGAEWYMLLVGAHMSGDQAKLQKRLGGYAFTSIEQLQQDLAHFSTLGYQPINDYAFNNKTVKQVFDELTALESKWKKLPSRPVVAQEGDRILKDYGNGIQWWFVDRGFCSEEGRSGKHCGNVNGKTNTDERILSLRHNMNVVLTFIYLPDGRLGEMKAKGNQKPSEHYHSYVMDLLLGNLGIDVTGITGAGWGPEFNFSIFDLDDNNLNVIMQTKPSFVSDQIEATPREILKAPDVIKNNSEYQQQAVSKQPALQYFFVNSKVDTSHSAWERAIEDEPSYIIYAPVDIKNYRNRVIEWMRYDPGLFLEAPRHIIKDESLVIDIVAKNSSALEYLPPAAITPKVVYTAVSKNGTRLEYVPEELKTPEICNAAVSNNGDALKYVPEELKTPKLCKIAVSNSMYALEYVPEELKTPELCKIAVSTNGYALEDVPAEFKTFELCKLAVLGHPFALNFMDDAQISSNQYDELKQITGKKWNYTIKENHHGSLARDNGDVITIGDARIDIDTKAQFSPRPQSVIEFLVPKELRGQGIGTQLLTKAVAKYPMLGGQVSSIASLKVFWNLGFRNPRMPEASFQDHLERMNEYSSVFMARTDEHGVPYENT